MILPRPQDAMHKMQLYRLLMAILDNPYVAQQVYFKGGTAATMLGFLDRFSIDLDFDLSGKADKNKLEIELKKIFVKTNLEINQQSAKELFYLLKYSSGVGDRNTIKLGLTKAASQHNVYAFSYLPEIDRYTNCQTVKTMFSHKLVSLTDRYKKYRMIAGRDLYDIHHFFLRGYGYIVKIIEERTGKKIGIYLKDLKTFIDKKINETIISQDLNYLLPADKFKQIRKSLKQETILLLTDEIKRLSQRQ